MRHPPDTIDIPIALPSSHFTPWYRFGIIDPCPPERAEQTARLRVLRDYCLHVQMEGISWIWCEAVQGSLDVYPGDLLFLPPGFVHGWTYVVETHLAIHFDLHHNPVLTPHNYNYSFDMLDMRRSRVTRVPVATMPVFVLANPAQESRVPWRIPLITHLTARDEWQERLEQLVYLWQIRQVDTPEAQMQFLETLGWVFTRLARGGEDAPAADDAGTHDIQAFLRTMRNVETLVAYAALSIPELAAKAGMGVTAFRQAFREATHRNPHRYLRERQVEQAAYMLSQTNRPVRDIARMMGFDDPYHFSRVFRQITGLSPQQYRGQASDEQ